MSITVCAIMLDEAEYVERWVSSIRRFSGSCDQMLVVDGGSTDGTADKLRALGVDVVVQPFPGDFAAQRNFLVSRCAGDWIFEVDADEVPSAPLLGGLRAICAGADEAEMDCAGVPRVNFLDNVMVPGPGYRGLDFQYRLHRRHCTWRGRVHEEVAGYKTRFELSFGDGHFLQHMKTSTRHAARNAYYAELSR